MSDHSITKETLPVNQECNEDEFVIDQSDPSLVLLDNKNLKGLLK